MGYVGAGNGLRGLSGWMGGQATKGRSGSCQRGLWQSGGRFPWLGARVDSPTSEVTSPEWLKGKGTLGRDAFV